MIENVTDKNLMKTIVWVIVRKPARYLYQDGQFSSVVETISLLLLNSFITLTVTGAAGEHLAEHINCAGCVKAKAI